MNVVFQCPRASRERIEARIRHAYEELQMSVEFDHLIVSYVGEGEIEQWQSPLTNETLEAFVSLSVQ